MFKEIGKIASLMKQAGELRGKMQDVQERLQQIRVEGTAAGGAVRIEMSGLQQVVDVQIAPALIRSGDAEAVSRMVLLAVNQALENSRKAAADAMGQATEGLDMGALGGLLGGGK